MSGEYQWIDDGEMVMRIPPPYLVEGVASVNSLVLVHGQSGAGKSFLGTDVAFAVASGTPWHGHQVLQGPVAYIAAEGQGGLSNRVKAWKQVHEIPERQVLGVHYLLEAVNPLDPDCMAKLGRALARLKPRPIAIFSDTWSANLGSGGGDENSTKDTAQAVAAWRYIMNVLKVSVWIIHHQGHGVHDRARGSGALKDNSDTEISVTQAKTGIIRVVNHKQRDMDYFDDMLFQLQVIDLGDEQDSCVLVPATGDLPTPGPQGIAENDRKALDALTLQTAATAILEEKEVKGLSYTQWFANASLTRGTFNRVVTSLLAQGMVQKLGNGRGATYLPVGKLTDENIWTGDE